MQIFRRTWNRLPWLIALGAGIALAAIVTAATYYLSPSYTQVGYSPKQPIEYSHRLHVRELGIDCRYCHANVERAPVAMVPPTQTCMNCHQLVKMDSAKLTAIRESWESGRRIEWVRVHKLADYAYFDHSVHVSSGVGCSDCHGRIDEMEQVRQVAPLSMSWCLDCHRDVRDKQGASRFIRPASEITNMEWKPDTSHPNVSPRRLDPPENCTACHR